MTDMYREIQEDIQREKWLALWQRFGRLVIGAAVAVVLLAIGFKVYQYYHTSRMMEYTNQLLEAVRKPSPAEFERVAADTKGVHADMARLIEAQLLVTEDKHSDALRLLEQVAASSADAFPNQLARALLANKEASLDKKSAFYHTGLERSGWAALQSGDVAAAKKAFQAIQMSDVAAESMKERAKSALAYIATQPLPATKTPTAE